MKIFIIIQLSLLSTIAFTQEIVKFPKLKATLDSIKIIDQQVQQDYINAKKEDRPKFQEIEAITFIRHGTLLKDIFNKYGFPNELMVGKEGSFNFWLGVQHCDHDLAFQKEVLKAMKIDVKKKIANGRNFAYLTDRVNINSDKPQIYGTQVTYENRTAVPKNLYKPLKVDKRRIKVGLEPIQEYLDLMTEMHRQMNPE